MILVKAFLKHQSLLQDFSYMYVVVIIQRCLGFALTYFLVRSLSQSQFAEYNLIISYIALFSAFSLPGMRGAVMQSTARGCNSFYAKAQKAMCVGTIIGAIALLIFAYMHKFNEDYSSTLWIGLVFASLFFPFYQGLTLWQGRLSGGKKFKLLSVLQGVTSIVTYLIIIYILIEYEPEDYLLLIIIYLFIPSSLNLIMFLVDWLAYKKETIVEEDEENESMMSYGLKTSFFSGFHSVALRLDSFVLFYLISPEVMAIYTIANKIPEMLRSVTQTLATILAPRFAKNAKLTSAISNAIKLYSLGFGVAIIVLTFTAYPYLMNFLFSDKYADATLYSQIIMCSLIIGNVANLKFRFIRSHKDSESYKNVTLIISFTKVLTAIILIPIVGIWGAIASLFLYRIAMLVSVEYIIRKKYT